MIFITTAVHATGMMLVMRNIYTVNKVKCDKQYSIKRVYHVSCVVILMFIVSLVEAIAWSVPYLWVDAIEGIEKTIYFSMVTYTTLGYGDVTLLEQWRLLASFEAANGIIMFGWTTAIVMISIKTIYFNYTPSQISKE